MIGPLRDYADLYVAACGAVLGSYAQGVDHERHCAACRGELESEPEEDAGDDDGDE